MAHPSFDGLHVLTLESRRATEVGALISNLGGRAIVAPSLKEVTLDSHAEAAAFADRLLVGEVDLVVFLTGVGVRTLFAAIEAAGPPERVDRVFTALATTRIAARGPKPVAALRERRIAAWAVAPEPSTWRELIAAIDVAGGPDALNGARVVVQEYGVPNQDLLGALAGKGARVTIVRTYEWALPDDVGPLSNAIDAIIQGEIDVVIVTSGVQRAHMQRVADESGRGATLREALGRSVIASIGPSASAELARYGSVPDLEASHPKMGVLVREAAEHAAALLARKR